VPLIAALASAALLLAACGGSSNTSSGSSKNASSGTGTTASTGGSGTAQSAADSAQAAKFSQCMRANGEPSFPDPNAKGQIQLMVTKGGSLDPQSATYKSALQKCKSLEPPGFGSNSTQSTANQNEVLQFVDCMRKHGVPNMPDPQSNGAMRITGINPQSPQFQSAMQTCRSYLPSGAVGG
jgi:hypothetical protein